MTANRGEISNRTTRHASLANSNIYLDTRLRTHKPDSGADGFLIQGLRRETPLMERVHFWLTDQQFERLVPYLPTDTRGKPRVDDRRVISGIIPGFSHIQSGPSHKLPQKLNVGWRLPSQIDAYTTVLRSGTRTVAIQKRRQSRHRYASMLCHSATAAATVRTPAPANIGSSLVG